MADEKSLHAMFGWDDVREVSGEEFARTVGTQVVNGAIAVFRKPEALAMVSGEILLPLIVFRGRRPPLVPFLVVALMGAAGGRMAYRSYKNLETIAQAARDDA